MIKTIFIFVVFLLLLDGFLFWSGRKSLGKKWPVWLKIVFSILYWAVPVVLVIILLLAVDENSSIPTIKQYSLIQYFTGLLVLVYGGKLIYLPFIVVAEIGLYIGKLFRRDWSRVHKIISITALIIAHFHFIGVSKGIRTGRFDFKVNNQQISFNNIPKSFDGFRILQFSDLHLGSFVGHENELNKAIQLIMEQKVDLVVFTGDLVNFSHEEVRYFESILSDFAAAIKVYTVLGNHDYHMRDSLVAMHHTIGFDLLLNESRTIYRGNDSILLIGVENWGLPPFPAIGNLANIEAVKESDVFKLLLSHDPTHWSEKVIPEYDVDLTLSGHTHGMQYGIKVGKYTFSPVALRYNNWKGLYKNGDKVLHVSTGLGYIAFPGRVGMPPEICIIELKKL